MFTKEEIERAIKETEATADTYEDCAKLATFYEILDHLYSTEMPRTMSGESDFLKVVNGKGDSVWSVLDELMETLKLINPHLYSGVMRKIAEL